MYTEQFDNVSQFMTIRKPEFIFIRALYVYDNGNLHVLYAVLDTCEFKFDYFRGYCEVALSTYAIISITRKR